MKTECPRCEQDLIKKVHVGVTDQTIFHCYECEATWFCEHAIEFATFLDLSTYLGRKNLEPSSTTYGTFVDDPNWHLLGSS